MKIMTVIGARPQFVKAAAFRSACKECSVEEILVHSGQHYDPNMSIDIFDELEVEPPDFYFNLTHRRHGSLTGEIMIKFEQLVVEQKPSLVNVFGDTNTTLAAALVAAKLNIPVSHIEAGLRSYNRIMPEETNRVLTDHVSSFLFCPTLRSVSQLAHEGITENVYHVGDIMYDCVKKFRSRFRFPSIDLKSRRPIAIFTLHRAENVNKRGKLKELIDFAKQYLSDYEVIFPVHPNTANKINEFKMDVSMFTVIPPTSYLETQGLLQRADLVLTDSGGMQKEAYFHRVKCITLRSETEWPETIASGWNSLWNSNEVTHKETQEIPDYGSGRTAYEILSVLDNFI